MNFIFINPDEKKQKNESGFQSTLIVFFAQSETAILQMQEEIKNV